MAYIDETKLINWCNETYKIQTTVIGKAYVNEFLQAVCMSEAEDVVPRSEIEKAQQEVAREIFEEIRKEIELALDSNYKARNNNGYGEFGEYVNGKIHALRGIDDFIAELKKKYTGDNNG